MRKTIIGCVSGAAFVLALAACSTSSSSPAAAISHPAGAAAPSATNCTVDCVTPVASTDAQWYAQVSGALGQVQQDLASIQADVGTPNLTVDGAQLAQDARRPETTKSTGPGRQRGLRGRDERLHRGRQRLCRHEQLGDAGRLPGRSGGQRGQRRREILQRGAGVSADQLSSRRDRRLRSRPDPGSPVAAAACMPDRIPAAPLR